MGDENQTTPPPPSEDLTPEEEKKFSKFLDKFLAEDDTPSAKTPPLATPTTTATNAPAIDVEAAVARALDSRESKSKDAEWKARVDAQLAQVTTPKKRKWFEPWTLFSGVI